MSLILILVVVLHPIVAPAQDVNLEVRLRNMTGEVARFLEGLPFSELGWATPESPTESRFRARLTITPPGTQIALRLKDGRSVEGRFEEATEEEAVLQVEVDERTQEDFRLSTIEHGSHVRLRFAYPDVESAQIPWRDGWGAPSLLHEVPSGKKIQVLLLDGQRVRGRTRGPTDQGFTLELEEDGEKQIVSYPFDEAVSFRTLKMPGVFKFLIGVGVAFGVVAALCTAGLCSQ